MRRARTALEIERRAISTNASHSSLDSRNILSILAAFENSQLAPLLYAAVDAAPKLLEILKRGNHRAAHYEPQQQHAQRTNDGVLCRQDHRANRNHLQDHLGLSQRRGWYRKTFR